MNPKHMNYMKINDEAQQQINRLYPDFDTTSKEFRAFEQLNLLLMFLINAASSLILSEKYNKNLQLPNDEQTAISHSLFRDAIMNYAKCFTTAGATKVKIDFNSVIKDFNEEDKIKFKLIHDEMIAIRHNYIAHNLDNDYERSIVATKFANGKLLIKPTYTFKTPLNSFQKFQTQCALVQNYLIIKVHKALTKLREKHDFIIEYT